MSESPAPVPAPGPRPVASARRRSRAQALLQQVGCGADGVASQAAADGARVPLGADAIDAALGGGLARGALHELFAAGNSDAPVAAGCAAMLAHRFGGPLLWLRQDAAQRAGGGLYGPGLAALGIDPGPMLLALVPDPAALLRAAGDALACAGLGAVIIELWQQPGLVDLTASRRLALRAAASGTAALLLRVDAPPVPSAAATRWLVEPAPSVALGGNAPGHPAFALSLLRRRGGPAGGPWLVEWNRDRRSFRDREGQQDGQQAGHYSGLGGTAPLPRHRLSLAQHRPDPDDGWRLSA